MKKITVAVLGSGGREHAVAAKFTDSPQVQKVYCIPGNGGTENNVLLKPEDFEGIRNFCLDQGVDLLFIGPEALLNNGIADFFEGSGIKVFGPDKRAAQLESSKIFAKNFMQKYGVDTAAFKSFQTPSEAKEYCRQLSGNCVIKYDGLAAGKGVFVCSDLAEADKALQEIEAKYGSSAAILVEEKLPGQELSVMAFTNGRDFQILLPSQDHKQLLEGDKGPNTGGMGAFCPVDFCDAAMMDTIKKNVIEPAFKGIAEEEFNYHGVLYFGLMIENGIPKVLEFNVRLGDPETEVVLPALKSDFAELVLACFDDSLVDLNLEFEHGYFVDVVLVSGGYPGNYTKGFEIKGLEMVEGYVFQAGTVRKENRLFTCGGRVLNIIQNGSTLENALTKCYRDVLKVDFEGMNYRKDIGRRSK